MSVLIDSALGYIKGDVVIRAEGCFLERFLNICMRRGIFLHRVKRCGTEVLEAHISIVGFKQLRPIAKKTRTRVRIKKRRGLPFLLHRYRKRKPLAAGILLFTVILWYLSTHIVGIDITGNERISCGELQEGLKAAGLYRGAAVARIDRRLVQNKMMTEFDDIAWIGINVKGSRAYIEIKERLDTEKTEDGDVPCNLVAARDGVVRRLEVRAGQTKVKTGDMVEKGDLLVSGAMDSAAVGIRYVHSDGAVYADTEYEKSRKYTFEYTENVYTGKEKKKMSAELFGKRINLFLDAAQPFEHCEKSEAKADYTFLGGRLKLRILSEVFKEYVPQKRKRTLEELLRLGKEELCRELEGELPEGAEILDTETNYSKNETFVLVSVKYFCRENIAVQSVIDKIENMDYDIVE